MIVRIKEKNFEIEVPDDAHFRFDKQPTYCRKLSGAKLKEMDVAYVDMSTNALILVEFSNYSKTTDPFDQSLRKNLITEMIAKGRDSLLMLQAAWRGIGAGKELCADLKPACRQIRPLRLCFVLKLSRAQIEQLHIMDAQGKLRSDVRVCADLLGLEIDVHLFTHSQAMVRLPITDLDP